MIYKLFYPIFLWFNDWQLKVNVSKCHILHLHKNNLLMDYYFNLIRLEPCYLVHDIGLDIDSLLCFDKHIYRIIVAKAYSRIGIIFRGFVSRCMFSGKLTLSLDHF